MINKPTSWDQVYKKVDNSYYLMCDVCTEGWLRITNELDEEYSVKCTHCENGWIKLSPMEIKDYKNRGMIEK